MKIIFKTTLLSAIVALFASDIWAQSSYKPTTEAPAASTFVKKRYKIKGTWNVVEQDGQKVIQFNDDFKTKGGPDLKLYLSSKTLSELDGDGVENSSIKLSVLKSNKGGQSYIIPADVNLSDYQSVLIHCEAYSVLWGGFDIAKTP